jgi:hypothetical protein
LHGAERHAGPDKHVAVASGTDEGIDVAGEVIRGAWRSDRCHEGSQETGDEREAIHRWRPEEGGIKTCVRDG